MGLRQAVEKIRSKIAESVHLMDQKGSDCFDGGGTKILLTSYVDMLDMALMASDDPTSEKFSVDRAFQNQEKEAAAQQVKTELKKKEQEAHYQEALGTVMFECSGGGADGTMIPCDSRMPPGAHIQVCGEVYTLQNSGGLLFNQEMTNKVKQQKLTSGSPLIGM